jgi:hypothetical protein
MHRIITPVMKRIFINLFKRSQVYKLTFRQDVHDFLEAINSIPDWVVEAWGLILSLAFKTLNEKENFVNIHARLSILIPM